ncbi:MAG: chemotaxis protein CheA [Pseudomonadota bacterium]|jgi:HPt (histidine-containing phosphotransfer) domain-containing protein
MRQAASTPPESVSVTLELNQSTIRAQARTVETLLHSMEQAIFSVDAEGKIVNPVSRYSEILFGTTISGKTVFETLYGAWSASGEEQGILRETLGLVIGSDEVQWELSLAHFPTRVAYWHPEKGERRLRCRCLPIWDEEQKICDHVLYVVEDGTELERLEAEVREERERNAKNLQVLQELMQLDRITVEGFFRSSAQELLDLEQGLTRLTKLNDPAHVSGQVEKLFRRVHTLKGNARTLNLSLIARAAHDFEQALEALRSSNSRAHDDADHAQVTTAFAGLRAQFLAYSDWVRRTLGLNDDLRRAILLEVEKLLMSLEIFAENCKATGQISEPPSEEGWGRVVQSLQSHFQTLGFRSEAEKLQELNSFFEQLSHQPGEALKTLPEFDRRLSEMACTLRAEILGADIAMNHQRVSGAVSRLRTFFSSEQEGSGGPPVVSWHELAMSLEQIGLLGLAAIASDGEAVARSRATPSKHLQCLGWFFSFMRELQSGGLISESYASVRQVLLERAQIDHVVASLSDGGFSFRFDPLTLRISACLKQVGELVALIGHTRILIDVLKLVDAFYDDGSIGHGTPAGGAVFRMPRVIPVLEDNFTELSQRFSELPRGAEFERLIQELPFGTLRVAFEGMIADLSRALKKSVRLTWEGSEILVDRRKLEVLREAISHVLPNAMDHGLESQAVRLAAGKPECGEIRITLSADDTRLQWLCVTITDDGGGVKLDRLIEKALRAGKISEAESRRLSQEELLQLIFLPGLSTVDQVSELSGRGVGMDVVRVAMERLHGQAVMSSEPGVGSSVRLSFPI